MELFNERLLNDLVLLLKTEADLSALSSRFNRLQGNDALSHCYHVEDDLRILGHIDSAQHRYRRSTADNHVWKDTSVLNYEAVPPEQQVASPAGQADAVEELLAELSGNRSSQGLRLVGE